MNTFSVGQVVYVQSRLYFPLEHHYCNIGEIQEIVERKDSETPFYCVYLHAPEKYREMTPQSFPNGETGRISAQLEEDLRELTTKEKFYHIFIHPWKH